MINFGYCCISNDINIGKKKSEYVMVNRGMIKRTFESRGLSYVAELSMLNVLDLHKILINNIKNGIYVYRMSSDMFPCIGFYNITDLPNFTQIQNKLVEIGKFIKDNKIRVSFHPNHFCIISSENDDVIRNALDELDKHSLIMDIMCLDQTNYYPINIHIGTSKPDLIRASDKFCRSFDKLSDSCKNRLTVENDDRDSMYSISMLYEQVYKKIGIPIVADSLHHFCKSDGVSWGESLSMATSTWSVKPMCHHSSSRKLYEDEKSKLNSHADFLYEKFDAFGIDLDVELECKQKDTALIKYLIDFE